MCVDVYMYMCVCVLFFTCFEFRQQTVLCTRAFNSVPMHLHTPHKHTHEWEIQDKVLPSKPAPPASPRSAATHTHNNSNSSYVQRWQLATVKTCMEKRTAKVSLAPPDTHTHARAPTGCCRQRKDAEKHDHSQQQQKYPHSRTRTSADRSRK